MSWLALACATARADPESDALVAVARPDGGTELSWFDHRFRLAARTVLPGAVPVALAPDRRALLARDADEALVLVEATGRGEVRARPVGLVVPRDAVELALACTSTHCAVAADQRVWIVDRADARAGAPRRVAPEPVPHPALAALGQGFLWIGERGGEVVAVRVPLAGVPEAPTVLATPRTAGWISAVSVGDGVRVGWDGGGAVVGDGGLVRTPTDACPDGAHGPIGVAAGRVAQLVCLRSGTASPADPFVAGVGLRATSDGRVAAVTATELLRPDGVVVPLRTGPSAPVVAVDDRGEVWVAWIGEDGVVRIGRPEGRGPVEGRTVASRDAGNLALAADRRGAFLAWDEPGPVVRYVRIDETGEPVGTPAVLAPAERPAVGADPPGRWRLYFAGDAGDSAVRVDRQGRPDRADLATRPASVPEELHRRGAPPPGPPEFAVVDGGIEGPDGRRYETPSARAQRPASAGGWVAWWEALPDRAARVVASPTAAPGTGTWPDDALVAAAAISAGVYTLAPAPDGGFVVASTLAGLDATGRRVHAAAGAEGAVAWIAAPGAARPVLLASGRVDDREVLSRAAAAAPPVRHTALVWEDPARDGVESWVAPPPVGAVVDPGARADCAVLDDGTVACGEPGHEQARRLDAAERPRFLAALETVDPALADRVGAAWAGEVGVPGLSRDPRVGLLLARAVHGAVAAPGGDLPGRGLTCDALADWAMGRGPPPAPAPLAPERPVDRVEPSAVVAVRDHLVTLDREGRLRILGLDGSPVASVQATARPGWGFLDRPASLLAIGDRVMVLGDVTEEEAPWGASVDGAARVRVFDLSAPLSPRLAFTVEVRGRLVDAAVIDGAPWLVVGAGAAGPAADGAVPVAVSDARGTTFGRAVPCANAWVTDLAAGRPGLVAFVRVPIDGSAPPSGSAVLGATSAAPTSSGWTVFPGGPGFRVTDADVVPVVASAPAASLGAPPWGPTYVVRAGKLVDPVTHAAHAMPIGTSVPADAVWASVGPLGLVTATATTVRVEGRPPRAFALRGAADLLCVAAGADRLDPDTVAACRGELRIGAITQVAGRIVVTSANGGAVVDPVGGEVHGWSWPEGG